MNTWEPSTEYKPYRQADGQWVVLRITTGVELSASSEEEAERLADALAHEDLESAEALTHRQWPYRGFRD